MTRTKSEEVSIVVLTLNNLDNWPASTRLEVAKWLREKAKQIVREGGRDLYNNKFTARYIVKGSSIARSSKAVKRPTRARRAG